MALNDSCPPCSIKSMRLAKERRVNKREGEGQTKRECRVRERREEAGREEEKAYRVPNLKLDLSTTNVQHFHLLE